MSRTEKAEMFHYVISMTGWSDPEWDDIRIIPRDVALMVMIMKLFKVRVVAK